MDQGPTKELEDLVTGQVAGWSLEHRVVILVRVQNVPRSTGGRRGNNDTVQDPPDPQQKSIYTRTEKIEN